MKYGVFSVCTPEYDIPDAVKMLKGLGYNGIELRVAGAPPETQPEGYCYENRYWTFNRCTVALDSIITVTPEIKQLCDSVGLEIISLTTYLGPWDSAGLEQVMEAARIIQCRNIRVNPPGYDGKENYRTLFQRTVAQVHCLENLAARYGVRINFEIHMGNIIPSASAAYRLVSHFDPALVGVIYDPGNMVFEGYENYQMGLELLGEYLAYVHVKNASWQQTGTGEDGITRWKTVWEPFSSGCVDLAHLCKALRAVGYDGYLSVEDFSNNQETLAKLDGNLRLLQSLIET